MEEKKKEHINKAVDSLVEQQAHENDDPPPLEDDEDDEIQTDMAPWRIFLLDWVNSRFFAFIMILLTIYALFGDDIRLAASEKPDDAIFFTISIIALGFFTLELCLNMAAKPG